MTDERTARWARLEAEWRATAAGRAGVRIYAMARPPDRGFYPDRALFLEDLHDAIGRLRGYPRPTAAMLADQIGIGRSSFFAFCVKHGVDWKAEIRAVRRGKLRVS